MVRAKSDGEVRPRPAAEGGIEDVDLMWRAVGDDRDAQAVTSDALGAAREAHAVGAKLVHAFAIDRPVGGEKGHVLRIASQKERFAGRGRERADDADPLIGSLIGVADRTEADRSGQHAVSKTWNARFLVDKPG